MMAPGPLDALPALLDIVANDERAAELSAAPSKEPMTLKIIRARVRIDFYPSAPAMAVDVRNLLLSARDHYAGRDTALAGHAMALLRRFENALAQEEGLPVDPAHEEPISALQAERLAEWRPAARNLDLRTSSSQEWSVTCASTSAASATASSTPTTTRWRS